MQSSMEKRNEIVCNKNHNVVLNTRSRNAIHCERNSNAILYRRNCNTIFCTRNHSVILCNKNHNVIFRGRNHNVNLEPLGFQKTNPKITSKRVIFFVVLGRATKFPKKQTRFDVILGFVFWKPVARATR